MGRNKITKMQMLEARHGGICRQVDAMFEAFVSLRTISAALQAQYGESISATSIWKYRRFWSARRDRIQKKRAAQLNGNGRLMFDACRWAAIRQAIAGRESAINGPIN